MNSLTTPKLKVLYWIILASLFSQIITFPPKPVSATDNQTAWSWSAASPTITSSNSIASMDSSFCPNSYKLKYIAGDQGLRKICAVDGNSVSFGIYYKDFSFQPYVGFLSDSKMHRITGICGQFDNCQYLPANDMLITRQYLINNMVRSLVIYRNFTQRLTKAFNTENLNIEYSFDSSNPDYIFQNSSGYAWPIGGIGISENNKWLAIEFRQQGIGLLNLETMQMKRVSNLMFHYNVGMNPSTELAVSNDGQYIAVMGINTDVTIMDITPNCGDEATEEKMNSGIPIINPCPISPTAGSQFIDRFDKATHPRFNDDGGELSFYAFSTDQKILEVSIRAAGYTGQRMDYLALGDSYSSGEGESDDTYYQAGTNNEFEKCHLSTRSYPYLIASLSGIDSNYLRSVACSGATMVDVMGDDGFYAGQGNRLGNKGLKLDDTNIALAQTEAINLFLPGRAHQESFVKKYKPKIITIGIGGNDTGFMGKLKACIGPGTCNWTADPQHKEQAAVEIKNLFGTLVNTYSELHAVSPNSKIYAIGYPKIISTADKCDPLLGFLLNSTEREFMNEGIMYLNQVIAAAAQKAGIKYLGIQESYGDHLLCGTTQPGAMNAIRTGDDNAIISQQNWSKFIGQESFHPTYLGHYYAAQSIIGSIGNILSFNNCNDNIIICPTDTDVPEPSTYWIPDNYHNYPLQKALSFVANPQPTSVSLQNKLTLPDLSLDPNSIVNVEIHSTPQSLGQFYSSKSGALDITINLPVNLAEGYHVIHVIGTSYSGEAIDLYQTIEFKIPAPPVDNTTQTDNTISADSSPQLDQSSNNVVDQPANQTINPQPTTANQATDPTPQIAPVHTGTQSITTDIQESQYDVPAPLDSQSVMGISTSNTETKQDPTKKIKDKISSRPFEYIPTLAILIFLTIIFILIVKKQYKPKR